ncbi:MAG: hypothetical protein FWG90_08880 [Oscillospiraceae bacterium]|nr:hypothetical protein [Oscillospiraceae bacterium]
MVQTPFEINNRILSDIRAAMDIHDKNKADEFSYILKDNFTPYHLSNDEEENMFKIMRKGRGKAGVFLTFFGLFWSANTLFALLMTISNNAIIEGIVGVSLFVLIGVVMLVIGICIEIF